ncbi:NmrA family NAD(P)-binding protein [Actinoplanes sp. NPDC049598]|uniref:NmrA family NAD(P)-binding protein n=1 Tax=Actinoplanes sp. NPDC049598 TaxID=3154626 RepID=UPI003447B761
MVGATGQQGGAVMRALKAKGLAVRALVRKPIEGDHVIADLNDRDSLAEAVRGVTAVFSMQMPSFKDGAFDFAGELQQAVNLIEAARAANVEHFVHSSVSGSRRLPPDERWAPLRPYYASKAGIEDRVRDGRRDRHRRPRPVHRAGTGRRLPVDDRDRRDPADDRPRHDRAGGRRGGHAPVRRPVDAADERGRPAGPPRVRP